MINGLKGYEIQHAFRMSILFKLLFQDILLPVLNGPFKYVVTYLFIYSIVAALR